MFESSNLTLLTNNKKEINANNLYNTELKGHYFTSYEIMIKIKNVNYHNSIINDKEMSEESEKFLWFIKETPNRSRLMKTSSSLTSLQNSSIIRKPRNEILKQTIENQEDKIKEIEKTATTLPSSTTNYCLLCRKNIISLEYCQNCFIVSKPNEMTIRKNAKISIKSEMEENSRIYNIKNDKRDYFIEKEKQYPISCNCIDKTLSTYDISLNECKIIENSNVQNEIDANLKSDRNCSCNYRRKRKKSFDETERNHSWTLNVDDNSLCLKKVIYDNEQLLEDDRRTQLTCYQNMKMSNMKLFPITTIPILSVPAATLPNNNANHNNNGSDESVQYVQDHIYSKLLNGCHRIKRKEEYNNENNYFLYLIQYVFETLKFLTIFQKLHFKANNYSDNNNKISKTKTTNQTHPINNHSIFSMTDNQQQSLNTKNYIRTKKIDKQTEMNEWNHQYKRNHSTLYCKFPHISFLHIFITILSFLSIFSTPIKAQVQTTAPISSAISGQSTRSLPKVATTTNVKLTRNESVCKSMDIKNNPRDLAQLANCTVIEGFLLIALVNTIQQEEFTESYPLLTEVTEFVVIYRIHNLRSLSQIFPNLSIIRGRTLMEGYAFVVFSNPHLEDLGLSKLTSIVRGGVRIENNISLCFVETIDWKQIVSNNSTDIDIKDNRAPGECPQCSNSEGGVSAENDSNRHCWSSTTFQKICPESCRNNCYDEKTCCNEACLGGCLQNNINICTSCRHYTLNDTCTDTCPKDYVSYLERRCLEVEACREIGQKYENNQQQVLVPFRGVCSTNCPPGYEKKNESCVECEGKCEKSCEGGLIDSIQSAKNYQGCTKIIKEGLTISIKRGGNHLMEELQLGLSGIQVIDTFLKVHLTFGMFSLEYFKNLRVIKGEKLCEERFALYVLENNDLETIWGPNQTVHIDNGRVFFHFNSKLCYSEIEKLLPMLDKIDKFDKNDVATDSNGSKGSCNMEVLNTTVTSVSNTVAVIELLNPLKFEDERTFIGYHLLYMADPYGNATKHNYRPCDDGWTAIEPSKEVKFIISNLQPYTNYAYYIKTMTISSEPRNAQSPIQYFQTKSAQPAKVRSMNAYANSSSEIIIEWMPPLQVNGKLVEYRIQLVLDKKDGSIESKNYCKEPLKNVETPRRSTENEKIDTTSNCQCSKDGTENGKSSFNAESVEGSIHDFMSFENSLQDFVYVKHKPSSSPPSSSRSSSLTEIHNEDNLQRRRRYIDDTTSSTTSYIFRQIRSLPSNDIEKLPNFTALKNQSIDGNYNETKWDENGKYIISFQQSISATEPTKFVFKELKHFAIYQLGVMACRENETGATAERCSNIQARYVRTEKLDDVDIITNLKVNVESTNTSFSNLRMQWDPPVRPNGAVVSYTIEYQKDTADSVKEKRCITEQDRSLNNGYLLTNLQTGNYTISVRTNSLAGEGLNSKLLTFYIPPSHLTMMQIILICLVLAIVLAILIGILCFIRRKYMQKPSDLKIFPTVNPYYISLQYIPDNWEVPREHILQLNSLGQGSFGMVYEGLLKKYGDNQEDKPCAIKTVNENATDRERMNFLNEASVMKQFDTHHVVRLLGVCSRGQPALVIMELMKNGDLKSYLRAHRPDNRDDILMSMQDNDLPVQPPPLSRIYQMAIEIADGMAYLAAKKFVHRDLAARNCMVAVDLTVKIGDFGMTRDVYQTDYYRKGTKGLLPVRWMPPESLRDGVYSSASDVFSYGVVLWEMATLASQPYQGLSNDQVLHYVIDGGVMERPENCPDELYCLMQSCWHHRPSARPSFMEIIRSLLEFSNEHFHEVSFYHTELGQQIFAKEIEEKLQNSGEVFNENENDDDVTTPLRMNDAYSDYRSAMNVNDNNSSVEHQAESPMVGDDINSHSSRYRIVSSTPDNKLADNSQDALQMSQINPIAPTSNIVAQSSSFERKHLPHTSKTSIPPRYQMPYQQGGDQTVTDYGQPMSSKSTDEQGYEMYDPSPNYREHAPSYNVGVDDDDDDDDDEEDFDGINTKFRPEGRLNSGGQNLLVRPKSKQQRIPTIIQMSSSMPNETIGSVPTSLHPSTASAASSNASSTTTATGRYPSLKRAVADTVQSRIRNINRRFFSHKRTGSNASHKSSSSNPNNSSNSNTNLTTADSGGSSCPKSMSGQNLGTIESGGSGSAGSYCPTTPRFFTPSSTKTTIENPNYKLLDESLNTTSISTVATTPNKIGSTSSGGGGGGVGSGLLKFKPSSSGFTTSTNPNYQLLDESIKSNPVGGGSTSENPNYESMQPPPPQSQSSSKIATSASSGMMHTSDNPNYIMMSTSPTTAISLANISENPNYQIIKPSAHTPTTTQQSGQLKDAPTSSVLIRPLKSHLLYPDKSSSERLGNSATSTTASSTSDEDDEADDIHGTENIPLERIPLSSSSNNRRRPLSSCSRSRSRSHSQHRADSTTTPTQTTAIPIVPPSSVQPLPSTAATFSLKEKWLAQQQLPTKQQQPPNGFIGREGQTK